jgi:hypothetical protein
MTKILINKTIRSFHDRNSSRVFANVEYKGCHFISITISTTRKPRRRSMLKNIKFINCEVTGCDVGPAIIEDVLVDGLKINNDFFINGAALQHVILRGKIGPICIMSDVAPGIIKPHEQEAFDKANAEYYSKIDWALDISEGIFEECDIRGIPTQLIKRDPETQVVVNREKVASGMWRQLDLHKTFWKSYLEIFLARGDPSVVLVAPKLNRRFIYLLEGLNILRENGIAEPD